MIAKPVLLGMCNPHSKDPKDALSTGPERATGWNVWQLIKRTPGMGGVKADEYEEAFDRRNLMPVEWDRQEARLLAPRMLERLRGRVVVILGAELLDALGLERREPGSWAKGGEMTWAWLPHPSGRCRWYNESGNRAYAGMVLAELYRRGRAACLGK